MASQVSPYKFQLLDLSKEGIDSITELLSDVFPDSEHITEDVIQWEYNLNPDGKAVGFNAWAGDILAGHYVTIPLRATINGIEEKGLLSLNTATHSEHRGKGLFTQLANRTYEYAAENGYSFVIGVANANSTHGFTKKLGFQLVGALKAMIGLGELPFGFGSEEIHYERIWNKAALKWRLSHPVYKYELSKGAFDTIYSSQGKLGARYVAGVFQSGTEFGTELKTAPSLPMKIWIGIDERFDRKGKLYVNIPMRLRPSPLNLIFKDLKGEGRTLNAENVRFQAIDFDTL